MLQILSQMQQGLITPQKTHGFHNQADAILGELNAMRRNRPFLNMSLGEFLPYWSHEKMEGVLDTSNDNRRKLLRDFFLDIGILDVGEVTVANLTMKRNDGAKWLFPELVRSALEVGLGDGPIYPFIVAEKQKVSGERTAVMPTVRFNATYPERLGEDESMPEAVILYSSRNVNIYPKGLSIKFSYDALSGMKIKLLQKFLQSQGKLIGLALDADALSVLINGDQVSGSMAAATIGVTNTEVGLQYQDIIRACTWIAGQGLKADTMIVSFADAINIFDMDEFKLKVQSGDSVITAKTNIPLPKDISVFAKSNMPEGKILILDSKNALVEFDAEPLLIETDKLIFERIEGTAASIRVGFANLWRSARVVIDLGHAYGDVGYGFDDYDFFTPLDNIPLTS